MYKFNKFDYALMRDAYNWADLSYSKRKKIGCVIARDYRIVTHGYNGMPNFLENECEDENGNTKSEVIHAEHNAILFAAKHGISLNGCVAYITCLPCKHCAAMIGVAGIKRVIYGEYYESANNGIDVNIFKLADVEFLQLKYDLTDPIWIS